MEELHTLYTFINMMFRKPKSTVLHQTSGLKGLHQIITDYTYYIHFLTNANKMSITFQRFKK
jgi:hypothetical protein